MSTAKQQMDEVRKNYLRAIENRDRDLAAASEPTDVQKILINVAAARDALTKASLAGLEANNAAVEDAYEKLKQANKDVEAARKAAQGIANIIRQLAGATRSAGDLVKAVASATKKKAAAGNK